MIVILFSFFSAIFPSSLQFQKLFRLYYYLLDQKRKTSINATQRKIAKLWKRIFRTKRRDTYKIDSLRMLYSNFELGVLFSLPETHTHTSKRALKFILYDFRFNSSTAAFEAQWLNASACACAVYVGRLTCLGSHEMVKW